MTPVTTSHERFLAPDNIIVSKTDLKGRITYANRDFLDIADYAEDEVLSQPHNIIRHPDMPRTIFKRAWENIAAGHEIFAYVKNLTKGGDFYWVLAHFTPTFAADGSISGYHSMRRAPDRPVIDEISVLYKDLCDAEAAAGSRKLGLEAGSALLDARLAAHGLTFDEFNFMQIAREHAA